jgi:hypothetical protein
MPVPFLPFDLIAAIVSHEEEEDLDYEEQISISKSVSLVCSTWRPLGQALGWRTIRICREQTPSLADHFARHPHLVGLVRVFMMSSGKGGPEPSGPSFGRQLTDLLRSFLNLRAVALAGKLGEDVPTILEILSRGKNLKKLSLNVRDKFEWTNELTSIFRQGFRQVSRLRLGVQWLEIPPQADTLPLQSGGCIPVRNFHLAWNGNSSQGPRFAQELFSTFDLNTVRSVALTPAAYRCSIDQLLLCPNLLSLEIRCSRNDTVREFSSILPFLPRFPSLRKLKVSFYEENGPSRVQSHVTLSAVVSSFPPSLEQFEAPQFVFLDSETLPLRSRSTTSKEHRSPVLKALYPLNLEPSETRKLTVWGEEGEGGCTQWFRDVDSGNDDEDTCKLDFRSFVSSVC